MSKLVAENDRFSQLVSDTRDDNGSTVDKQDMCSQEPAAGNRASTEKGDAAAMSHQINSVVELMQETLAALNLARAEIEMKAHPPRSVALSKKEGESDAAATR